MRASCEATASFGELLGGPTRELPNLPISAEVSNCQPVEETELPAVPVGLSSCFTICDCGHEKSPSSASLRRARDVHVCSGQCSRRTASSDSSYFPCNPPEKVPRKTSSRGCGRHSCSTTIACDRPPGSQTRTCPKRRCFVPMPVPDVTSTFACSTEV